MAKRFLDFGHMHIVLSICSILNRERQLSPSNRPAPNLRVGEAIRVGINFKADKSSKSADKAASGLKAQADCGGGSPGRGVVISDRR